jgi:peroxiredoxin
MTLEYAPDFELPMAGGGTFNSTSMSGRRWLLSFHRHAT